MTDKNQLPFFNLGSYLKWVQRLIKGQISVGLWNQNLMEKGVYFGPEIQWNSYYDQGDSF